MFKMLSYFNFIIMLIEISYASEDEAPWIRCSSEELEVPISSTGVQVFVSGCHAGLNACSLHIGTNHTIVIHFTPTISSQNIERVIIAKFPKLLRGKSVEVPYGGVLDACLNTRDSNGDDCQINGLIANQSYIHEMTFPVFENTPKVELRVRYMIRTALTNSKKPQDWRKHSGPYFICVEIPVRLV